MPRLSDATMADFKTKSRTTDLQGASRCVEKDPAHHRIQLSAAYKAKDHAPFHVIRVINSILEAAHTNRVQQVSRRPIEHFDPLRAILNVPIQRVEADFPCRTIRHIDGN